MKINIEKAVKDGVEQAMREYELTIGMTLKEAVERQVPKKPNPDTKFYGFGFCPTCNACFMDKSTNYCGNCGQKLDWEKSIRERD